MTREGNNFCVPQIYFKYKLFLLTSRAGILNIYWLISTIFCHLKSNILDALVEGGGERQLIMTRQMVNVRVASSVKENFSLSFIFSRYLRLPENVVIFPLFTVGTL